MDETGEATLPYALVEISYHLLGTKKATKQHVQATTNAHGRVQLILETGGKAIEWKLRGEDTRYFCSAETVRTGLSFDRMKHKITMHCDSFIAVMRASDEFDVLRRFERAVAAARDFALRKGEVLLLRNHVVNHHEYDTNQIYGGLIGRRVTAAYEKIVSNGKLKAGYDTLYNPYVLYRTEHAKQRYILDEVESMKQRLAKAKGMSEVQKEVLIEKREEDAKRDMADLSRLVEPTLKDLGSRIEKEFQRGLSEVEVLREKFVTAMHEREDDEFRQLLQDAQESGAKSPIISTVLFDDEDLPEAVASVCQYAVERFKDGINLELMLLAGPADKGLNFEDTFESLDVDNVFLATAHRSEEKRKKDAELKEFGIWSPGLPLDGSPDLDGFRILKRCVLKVRDTL